MFGLCAAVAIRLRSIHVPSSDFVLEFFLPVDCRDAEEQKRMLCSLSIIIQKVCPSLRVVTDKELEETPSLVSELTVLSDGSPARDETEKLQHTPTEKCSQEQSSWTACLKEAQQSSSITPPFQKEKVRERLSERYPIPPAFCTGRHGKLVRIVGGLKAKGLHWVWEPPHLHID
ncbi:Protein NLP5 [Vitis vinifera]|uniref:Protein NLP5 n=1 Tax=Vitis vinifera TaxID=29760 RepID=A0A438K4D5_VITVI|nr:Protein NLP5 [Vitis vinifera]